MLTDLARLQPPADLHRQGIAAWGDDWDDNASGAVGHQLWVADTAATDPCPLLISGYVHRQGWTTFDDERFCSVNGWLDGVYDDLSVEPLGARTAAKPGTVVVEGTLQFTAKNRHR